MFGKKKNNDIYMIEDKIDSKHSFFKIVLLLIGTFLVAFSFNMFEAPNDLVTGGVTGLAVIFNKFINLSTSDFVLIANIICTIIGLIFLGYKKTLKMVLGGVMLTIMMYLTEDLPELLNLNFSHIFYSVICDGILVGVGCGLVYKAGFTTGGTEIIGATIAEKAKKPLGQVMFFVSGIIIVIGAFVFGAELFVCALIVRFIMLQLSDRIMLGLKNTKMFFIQSKKKKEIKEYIYAYIGSGLTKFESRGGYSNKNNDTFMCVVPNDKYFKLQEAILEIDPDAFVIISDCYNVVGGTKRYKLPFYDMK